MIPEKICCSSTISESEFRKILTKFANFIFWAFGIFVAELSQSLRLARVLSRKKSKRRSLQLPKKGVI